MLPTEAQFESHISFLPSVTSLESEELEKLVAMAHGSNAAFFDTAERYGSHAKTMMGLGYGETEKLTQLMLSRAREVQGEPDFAPIVATKFTPTPWRTTAQSVVDACEMSCKNLGVDQIDLYQIHMPDIVHPVGGREFVLIPPLGLLALL